MLICDIPHINADLQHLLQNDPLFSRYSIDTQNLSWPSYEKGFAGLVRIVQSQQISTKVANTLWQKLTQSTPITPENILAAPPETLKSFGLSAQKQNYIRALAQNILDENFSSETLETLPDKDVITSITSQKGFGLWSAQIYLIFSLHRPDILPMNDLGLDRAAQNLFNLPARPDYKTLGHHTNQWKGKRTAASLLLWHIGGNKPKPR